MLHSLRVSDLGLINVEHDPTNSSHVRNIRNSDKGYYNCGGYALNTFTWYLPYNKGESFFDFDLDTPEGMQAATYRAVTRMLSEIPKLRVIADPSDAGKGEYVLAFRIGRSDFHFVKRGRNHHWYHKMGGRSEIEKMTEEEVFASSWFHRYNGPLVLFAKSCK